MESVKFDIWTPVEDWFSNIHYAHNPKSILVDKEDFGGKWKDLFSVPYLEQHIEKKDGTSEANPKWLELKEDFISGSEVGAAIGENQWETTEDYVQFKSGKKKKVFEEDSLRAMSHGNKNEHKAGLRYTYEVDDITFKFGLIPHKDKQWSFLGVSPDLVRFYEERAVEIKSPYKRMLCYLKVDEVPFDGFTLGHSDDVKVLIREVMITGDRHKYLSITNLPLKWSKLLDKYIYYWHQCQLQAEVLNIGDTIDFVQFGTCPNPFYMNSDLLTITEVPRDTMWLANYGDRLRKTWDQVLYYRSIKEAPKSSYKKRKLVQVCDAFQDEDDDDSCPFTIAKEVENKKIKKTIHVYS